MFNYLKKQSAEASCLIQNDHFYILDYFRGHFLLP